MDRVEHLEPHKTSQVLLFAGSRQNIEVGGSCEACPCPDLYKSIKYDPQGVTISAGCWSWNKCFPRRACETVWLDGCEVFCFASCPLSMLDSICWDAPARGNNHHQNHYMFIYKGIPINLHFPLLLGRRTSPNIWWTWFLFFAMSQGQLNVLLMIGSGNWRFIMDCFAISGYRRYNISHVWNIYLHLPYNSIKLNVAKYAIHGSYGYVSFVFQISAGMPRILSVRFRILGRWNPSVRQLRIAHEMDLEHMLISWTVLSSPRYIHPEAP